jgi:hypothetical protein
MASTQLVYLLSLHCAFLVHIFSRLAQRSSLASAKLDARLIANAIGEDELLAMTEAVESFAEAAYSRIRL